MSILFEYFKYSIWLLVLWSSWVCVFSVSIKFEKVLAINSSNMFPLSAKVQLIYKTDWYFCTDHWVTVQFFSFFSHSFILVVPLLCLWTYWCFVLVVSVVSNLLLSSSSEFFYFEHCIFDHQKQRLFLLYIFYFSSCYIYAFLSFLIIFLVYFKVLSANCFISLLL